MSYKKRLQILIIFSLLIVLVVLFAFDKTHTLLQTVRTHSYQYGYNNKVQGITDTSKMKPAIAVPTLMYHGVVVGENLGLNTTRNNFIAQMEMLKKEGYQTVSVKEYDLFREGKFVLPAKPILISFDDGRKDSFYTVDEILKKLDFKATLFVATGKANQKDSFYLGWDELKNVRDTGRWEIEAHGRHSHDRVIIDENGNMATYLTSRIYDPKTGLESVENYKKRVEEDYIGGVEDLKINLGIDAHYFAVPLNDYGDLEISNVQNAYEINVSFTDNLFKLAFMQAENGGGRVSQSFYNYKDAPANKLKRLEVQNISASELKETLDRFAPKLAKLTYSKTTDLENLLSMTQLLYGQMKTENGVSLISDKNQLSSRVKIGDDGWQNYMVKMRIDKAKGRALSILTYYTDEENFIKLNLDTSSLKLIERVKGKEKILAESDLPMYNGDINIIIYINDNIISAKVNDTLLVSKFSQLLYRGAVAFGVWDPMSAEATIKELEIVGL